MSRRTPLATPGTASRRAREGEVFYSVNGSPLGVVEEQDDNEAVGQRRGAKAAKTSLASKQPSVTVTLSKAQPTRSRTRRGAAAADEAAAVADAIKLTTADGEEIDLSKANKLSKDQKSWALETLNSLANQVGALLGRLK